LRKMVCSVSVRMNGPVQRYFLAFDCGQEATADS
jgi:hypothetical protein